MLTASIISRSKPSDTVFMTSVHRSSRIDNYLKGVDIFFFGVLLAHPTPVCFQWGYLKNETALRR